MNSEDLSPASKCETGTCPSDFGLERHRLGEASGSAEGRLIAAHLAGCGSCTDRLIDLGLPPPRFSLDEVWQAARGGEVGKRPVRRRVLTQVAAVAAFATVCLAALAIFRAPSGPPADLIKGGAWNLTVIAKLRGREEVAPVSSGVRLAEGDRLRFEVSTAWARGFAAIISLDSSGAVSAVAPVDGEALEVRGGQRRLVAGAVELDSSTGSERIELVGCPRPFAMADLLMTARAELSRQGGDLRKLGVIQPGCHAVTFWIEKASR
jgi:hypothetical protein